MLIIINPQHNPSLNITSYSITGIIPETEYKVEFQILQIQFCFVKAFRPYRIFPQVIENDKVFKRYLEVKVEAVLTELRINLAL